MAELVSRGSVEITILDLTDSKRLISFINMNDASYTIYNPDTNTYVPDYGKKKPILTPYLQVDGSRENLVGQADEVIWYYQVDSTGDWAEIEEDDIRYTINKNTFELTLNENIMALHTFMTFHCEIHYTVNDDEYVSLSNIELVKIINGTSGNNSIVGVLDNDHDTIHTDTNGNGGNFDGIVSTMSIYDGTIDVTDNWNITVEITGGVVGSLNGGSYTVTDLTTDHGEVKFTASRGERSVERIYKIDKIRSGKDGELNRILVQHQVIRKDKEDNYTPTVLPIKAQKKKGTSDWEELRVAFRVSSSLDGETYDEPYYESISLEDNYDYYVENHISMIKVEMFDSLDFDNILDVQFIPIVVDGKDNILAVIHTEQGVISRNGETILTADMRLYLGGELVTPSHYQWYKIDPSSPGDSSSGSGWAVLSDINTQGTQGYNTNTLVVPPEAIDGSDTFMCIVPYKNRELSATITLSDISDPYIVSILGSGVFKNSEGVNTYTGKVYRDGIEMDTDPTDPKYEYTWNLYDQSNVLVEDFLKAGKTITISADEVKNRGVLTCTVDEK